MSKLNTIFHIIKTNPKMLPQVIVNKLVGTKILDWMPDKAFLELRYLSVFGRRPNWKNPKTFNEKIQWLKLYDRKDFYTGIVDKYSVRDYIARKWGESHLIPLLGVWESAEDVDFDALPEKFVLKCTHGSKCNIVCTDKAKLDIAHVRKSLSKWMKTNYYYHSREWPYKSVKPRIIAEKYMLSSGMDELIDYKFYCNNGNADYVMVCVGRAKDDLRFLYFDKDWNFYRFNYGDEVLPEDFSFPMPPRMTEMFQVAEHLSQGFRYLRVDLYESGGELYFGELTLYPSAGFDQDILPETDLYFGSLIELGTNNADESVAT